MKVSPKGDKKLSPDGLMRNVAKALIRDFRTNLDDPFFAEDHLAALCKGDIGSVRGSTQAPNDNMTVAEYKATYQVQSLFKRYRFETDLYSDKELEEKSILTFNETQRRIKAIDLNSVSAFTKQTLRLAKIYITHVLGEYDEAEHRSLCRFGKRASVGVPSRMACEAARWELPITGSLNQQLWFDSEMSNVECVQNYWIDQLCSDPSRSVYKEIDSLQLTLVPKTFKSFRSIMPNTTLGSYQSYGLGEVIRKRLKRKGYDIKSLQQTHKYLAQQASVTSRYTTADLSSASDSISVALVNKLFPGDWLDALHQSRIGNVTLPDKSVVQSSTFCTMGIGYTFPLQTLVFLALLKALHAQVFGLRFRSTISVYGDDMIYISSLHSTVVDVFSELGFVINIDKTFHEGHFRESCGGDYYHGVDVRPFQPQNGSASVSSKAYEAILYKIVNGLLARWSEYEIRSTLMLLMSELELVTGKAKMVPCDYPDDSGIKCSLPWVPEFLQGSDGVAWPQFVGHGVYRFSYLRLVPDKRKEERHEPFLWSALRVDERSRTPHYKRSYGAHRVSAIPTLRIINEVVGCTSAVPELCWAQVRPVETFRSKLRGVRLRRLESSVVISHTGRYTSQAGRSCFECP